MNPPDALRTPAEAVAADPISTESSRRPARRRLLYYAFGLSFITYLDRVCISAAAPSIMHDLQLSVVQMSFVFGAFTLAYSLFEVPSGWMGDVFGPRRVLTRIVVWWSVFTMLTGLAWSYVSLMVMRFLFGAGEAGAFPNASRSFARWFPQVERGKANGILFLGSRLGGAIAPALAFLLIRVWGWRESFYVFGSIGFVWAFAWFRWFRDNPSEHPEVSREELQWIRRDDAGGNHVAAQDGGVIDEAQLEGVRVPWKAIIASRNLRAVCGMYFAFGYGLYFYFTWLPTYLIRELGFSGLSGGFFAGLPFLLAGGADVLGGWLTDRLSVYSGLRVGRCWLGAASFASSGALLLLSTQLDSRIFKATLIAAALGCADLALSACWAVCLDIGREYAGVVTGFMNTFGNLGGFAGPLVVGFLVQKLGSWVIPFYLSSAMYLSGALLWLLIDPRKGLGPPLQHSPEGSNGNKQE